MAAHPRAAGPAPKPNPWVVIDMTFRSAGAVVATAFVSGALLASIASGVALASVKNAMPAVPFGGEAAVAGTPRVECPPGAAG